MMWGVIIFFTIISFVIFFNPATQYGARGSGSGNFGSIDGKPVSKEELQDALTEVSIRYRINYGEWPDQRRGAQFDENREAYFRLFLIRKLEENDIHVSSDSVARTARMILRGYGGGQDIPLSMFVTNFLAPRADAEDFERLIRHDLGIQQLISVVGVSGDLITPGQAELVYRRNYEEIIAEAAFFSASNYLAGVTNPSPEALPDFYEFRQANYREPDRVQVTYVMFPVNAHTNEAELSFTNLAEQVELNLAQIGTNFTQFAATQDEARIKIREELISNAAARLAYRKASDFANELFSIEPVKSENLAELASRKGLEPKVSEPFDAQNGPREFDGGPNFARVAFRLTPEEPFSEQPLAGTNAFYVMALKQKISAHVPPLAEIRDRVIDDFKFNQAAMQARLNGMEFSQSISNALAQGKTFESAAQAAKAEVLAVPPFSAATGEMPLIENHLPFDQFRRIAENTAPGTASQFIPTRDGGFIVFVRERRPVDPARMASDLPQFLRALRAERREAAFSMWFNREAPKSLQNTPVMQQQTGADAEQGPS